MKSCLLNIIMAVGFLPIEEQQDMYDQWHAMVLYKSALGRRLVRKGFKDIFNKGDGA